MLEQAPRIQEQAATLSKLMPNLSDQQRVENSVIHAENRGEKNTRANRESRVGTHLARITKLLEREGVEARVWDSAVEELIIKPEDISDSYWKQQEQIARDNGHGDIRLIARDKEMLTEQLQGAQRTGLESWRTYLESTGDQYPVWFKFYVWDGMSRLGVFDKSKGYYTKRSSGTVAPYPQLNPAALGKVFEAVKDQGGDDEAVAKLVKSGNFNKLYSHMLLEQKAVIPTPENAEDVKGEWREYTSEDTQAIAEASEGTPWCIAGRSMAESYTRDGGRFLLFHLQDPETGVISPTAAASIRLNGRGEVVELSGLKGGASQYIEDALVPTVMERVRQLPGGERYLQAFEDKQMLIQMDRKFKNGEPFTREEILFLYEVDRPIRYLDTYARDPRAEEFKRNKLKHIQLLAEMEGVDVKEAELMITSDSDISSKVRHFLREGFDPNIIADRLDPMVKVEYIDELIKAGAEIDLNDLYEQLEPGEQLTVFSRLQERGAALDPDELADRFEPRQQIREYNYLKKIGASITAEDIADKFDDKGKLANLLSLQKIGVSLDADELIVRSYGEEEVIGLNEGVSLGEMDEWLRGGASPELVLKMLKMGGRKDAGGGVESSSAVEALRAILRAVPKSGLDQGNFIDNFYRKIRENDDTFVGFIGGGTYNFRKDFLIAGFDVNIVARKIGVDGSQYGGDIGRFMDLGVDKQALLDGMTLGRDGRIFSGDEKDYDRTYHVSQNIAALVEYGCDIKDIVSHIAKKYQLESFEELQQYGAGLDINELISSMNPDDVIENIEKAIELGADVDVNELLDSPELRRVWVYKIDELLALGADPQKIAAKIPPHEVGYNYRTRRFDKPPYNDLYGFRKRYPEIFRMALERVKKEVAEAA